LHMLQEVPTTPTKTAPATRPQWWNGPVDGAQGAYRSLTNVVGAVTKPVSPVAKRLSGAATTAGKSVSTGTRRADTWIGKRLDALDQWLGLVPAKSVGQQELPENSDIPAIDAKDSPRDKSAQTFSAKVVWVLVMAAAVTLLLPTLSEKMSLADVYTPPTLPGYLYYADEAGLDIKRPRRKVLTRVFQAALIPAAIPVVRFGLQLAVGPGAETAALVTTAARPIGKWIATVATPAIAAAAARAMPAARVAAPSLKVVYDATKTARVVTVVHKVGAGLAGAAATFLAAVFF